MNIGIVYYLACVLHNLDFLLAIIGLAGSVFTLAMWLTCPDTRKEYKKLYKTSFIACLTCLGLFVVTPDKKSVMAMYIAPKIENNEKVQMLTDATLDRIIEFLKKDSDGESSK